MGERVGVCPARRRAETAEQEGCRHLGRGGGGGGGWIVIFLRGRERKAHQRRNARVLFGVQGDECTRPTTRETCIGLLLNKTRHHRQPAASLRFSTPSGAAFFSRADAAAMGRSRGASACAAGHAPLARALVR
jgi:hypothetical protein